MPATIALRLVYWLPNVVFRQSELVTGVTDARARTGLSKLQYQQKETYSLPQKEETRLGAAGSRRRRKRNGRAQYPSQRAVARLHAPSTVHDGWRTSVSAACGRPVQQSPLSYCAMAMRASKAPLDNSAGYRARWMENAAISGATVDLAQRVLPLSSARLCAERRPKVSAKVPRYLKLLTAG
jgi:hypothetical protein